MQAEVPLALVFYVEPLWSKPWRPFFLSAAPQTIVMDLAVDASLASVAPIINKMIEDYDGTESKQYQKKAHADNVINLLLDSGLAEKRVVKLVKCGVHPENRSTFGLDTKDVHELQMYIIKSGWSWSECNRAWAIEASPGEQGKRQFEFQQMLAAASDGQLPTMEPTNLEILTFACSHTVAGPKCALAQSRSPNVELCTEDGRLSVDKICAMAPSYKEAVDRGLEWVVINHKCEIAMPMLCKFLSTAANSGGGAQRMPTKVQILLEIHGKAVQNMNVHKDWRFFSVLRFALVLRPTQ